MTPGGFIAKSRVRFGPLGSLAAACQDGACKDAARPMSTPRSKKILKKKENGPPQSRQRACVEATGTLNNRGRFVCQMRYFCQAAGPARGWVVFGNKRVPRSLCGRKRRESGKTCFFCFAKSRARSKTGLAFLVRTTLVHLLQFLPSLASGGKNCINLPRGEK